MYKILIGSCKTVEKQLNDLDEEFNQETTIEACEFDNNSSTVRLIVKCYDYFNEENNDE